MAAISTICARFIPAFELRQGRVDSAVKVARVPIELSPHNPRIERVRDLRAARVRHERGRFVIEGPTLLAEANASGLAVDELYGTSAALERERALVATLERTGTQAFAVPERTIARLSDLDSPPGLLAVAVTPAATLAGILARPGPVLLLAAINDPGNAGTLVRSAEAFGAAGVLFGAGGVDPYAPKVVRAAMGSLFRLPAVAVEAEDLLAAAAAAGRAIVAADLAGEPLAGATIPADAIVAIGHERHGAGVFLPRWDRSVRIEQAGAAESLNAAVAGSILLYVLARRR
jgi:TrmH family RNA methyltransferase